MSEPELVSVDTSAADYKMEEQAVYPFKEGDRVQVRLGETETIHRYKTNDMSQLEGKTGRVGQQRDRYHFLVEMDGDYPNMRVTLNHKQMVHIKEVPDNG